MKKILLMAILSFFLFLNPANAAYCLVYESMNNIFLEKGYEITKVFLDDNNTKYELYMHMKDGKWAMTFIRFVHSPSSNMDVKFSCLIAKGDFSMTMPSKSF